MTIRRKASAALLTAVLGLTAACGGSGGSGGTGRTLTYQGWGGYYQKAQIADWLEPWSKKTGNDFVEGSPTDYAKLEAQVKAGKTVWDLVDVAPHYAVRGCAAGNLEKIDYTVVDKSKLPANMVSDCGVPIGTLGYLLSYNTEKTGAAKPASWADFYDTKKFPGKRAVWRYATGGQLETALLADGVPADGLYPLDVDRALKKLSSIRDDVVFFDTGDQMLQLLSSGEVSMAIGWHSEILKAQQEDEPLAVDWNQHLVTWDDYVIPKGSKNKDLAMDLINYALGAQQQADVTNGSYYGPVNPDADALVKPELAHGLPSSPENKDKGIPVDNTWWAENYAKTSATWTSWVTGS